MFRYIWIPLVLVTVTAGCHLRPNWGPPGTIGMQRSRAVLNDPFPSDELGPQIMGARPLGFDRPEARAEGLQKYAPQNQPPLNQFNVVPQPIAPLQPGY